MKTLKKMKSWKLDGLVEMANEHLQNVSDLKNYLIYLNNREVNKDVIFYRVHI